MVYRRRLVQQPELGDGKIEILAAAPAGTSAARVRPRRAKALALPGLTLLLIATAPQANGSRAKRRHPASHVSVGDSSTVSGLARTQSSIPGVSIWTSKGTASRLQPRRGAAAPATAFAPSTVDSDTDALSGGTSASRLREETELNAGSARARRVRRRRSCRSSDAQNLLGVDCQDGSGNLGDADVEPPSRGAREEEEELEEDYAAGVMTTEEGEEDTAEGNADAAPGRMLEEGGGSDSQEDESEDDDDSNNNGGGDSYDDGSGDSESDEDDEEGLYRGGSKGWGRGGVVRGRYGRGLQQLLPKEGEVGDGGGGKGMVSLAKKYEADDEACFARVKELWQDRIEPPLSSVEVGEISEIVRVEQKKLLESAPTEWNSGLRMSMGGRRKGGAGKGVVVVQGDIAQGQFLGGSSGGDGDIDYDGEDDEDYDEEGDYMTSLGLLHRLLLAEMRGEGTSGGLNNRWIDRDALLQLRGAATLAHHPEYLRHTASLPRVTRGVRLVAPEATHSMQEAFARSLGHSTGSNVVFLDGIALDAVRTRALAEGIPKDRLSSRKLTSALLELAGESSSPSVVFLKDKGSVALKSRGVCHRLTEELKSQSSRVLFLLSTVSDPSVPGNDASLSNGDGSVTSPGDSSQLQQQQGGGGGGGIFGSGAFHWPPGQQPMSTGQSKRSLQQDGPKKNYIFLQQTSPNGDNRGYFGGRSPRGGRGSSSRSEGGRGQPGQGFGRGMPGPPIPPQMLEQLLREAMKSMKEAGEQANTKSGDVSNNNSGHTGDGSNVSGGDIPPGLLEALGEALNDDDFKSALEQIGKQLSKDINQGFSIMFSTSSAPPPGGGKNQGIGDGNGEGDEEDVGDGESSMPWGGPASAAAAGKPGSWQSSGGSPSSLSWLTNLRKGIMSGDEGTEGDEGNEENYEEGDEGRGSGGGDGRGSSGGGDERKPDSRRGVDLPPSGTEIRAFTGLFEDVNVEPPQDAILRQHWDAWVKEDVGKHTARHNKEALMVALRRNALACPELKRLEPLLARHRLTEAETGQVVLSALKVELSKAAVSLDGLRMREGEDTPLEPPRMFKGRLVISRQSMETAFAAVCKAYVPRPGQPMSRTREEVAALAQNDRHEQALVTNVILPKDIGVTYDMIGGLGGAKELLRQCITYPLRFPHLYNEGIAKEAVKGVLLFGPPGTGKTMLAKAVATEGGATFLSVDASVIENKWLGESEKNARAVFTLARRLAPCVVFIDEVDSVLSSREKYDDTTHGTLTSVKTTLMQEWDGLRTGGDRVVVIASTNRPFDLDEAVLRRLPRRILVDLPDAETREEILRVSMAQNRVDASVNFTAITAELEGFTGSDIKEVCREAVVRIAHEKAKELDKAGEGGVAGEDIDLTVQLRPVTMDDFREARKKLTASVSEKGRELAKVWEWNEEYGEVKKKRSDASAPHLSMYT